MKLTFAPATLFSILAAPLLAAGPVLPPGQAAEAKLPSKWFDRAKEFPEALEIQKQTGADIFIYFARNMPSDQKGLCRWFEGKSLKTGPLNRLLKDYIKVQITLPSNDEDEALAARFRVQSCPTLIIVQPDGHNSFCKPFDYPGGKPELKDPEDLAEEIRTKSSAKYQAATAPTDPPAAP
jgi:hypothetical protein